MLLTIEGIDRSGKSTLSQVLSKLVSPPAQIKHFGVPSPSSHPLDDLCQIAHMYQPSSGHHLIFDRLHIGENVYGELYRHGSRLTPAQRWWLDLFYQARGMHFIHVTARADVIVQRCRTDGEDYLKPQHVEQVLAAYYEECSDIDLWQTVDTTDLRPGSADYEATVSQILRSAMTREAYATEIAEASTDYVGPHRPAVLLVADRPSDSPGRLPAYGAMTPWNNNSAEFLIHSLMDTNLIQPGLDSQLLGFVNSDVPMEDTTSLKPNLVALDHALGNPPIIAIGNNAALRLEMARIPYMYKIQHPQFVKRFSASTPRAAYGERLTEMIKEVTSE